MIIETTEYNFKLITIFIKWYFIEVPKQILYQLYKYIVVISKIYSFAFLLKTFFSPWKGQIYEYPQKGFDLSLIFQTWTSNMISRLVGSFVRGVTMIIGIIVLLISLLIGGSAFIIWILYPVIFFLLIILSL
jgi:hypothetical protein